MWRMMMKNLTSVASSYTALGPLSTICSEASTLVTACEYSSIFVSSLDAVRFADALSIAGNP